MKASVMAVPLDSVNTCELVRSTFPGKPFIAVFMSVRLTPTGNNTALALPSVTELVAVVTEPPSK